MAILLLLLGLFLIYKVRLIKNSYKKEHELTQQKIEDLKLKNDLLLEKNATFAEYPCDVNQMVKEVSDLHQRVMKKYLN